MTNFLESITPVHRHSPRRRRRGRRYALTAAAALAGSVLTAVPSHATWGSSDIYFGAAGEVQTLRTKTGAAYATHAYTRLGNSVPSARMITVNSDASFARVAAARPGSEIHNDLVRWARTLKTRGPVFLAYGHEPEAGSGQGTPAEFKAAFRKVVQVMRSNGATNVAYTLQMTAWSFRASSSSRSYIGHWYPGDDVVDVVGADAYNWYSCGEGRGRWNELSAVAGAGLAFAKRHGKQFALPEFASHTNSRRAQWLRNAKSWLEQNKGSVAAAFYFNRLPTNRANSDCRWPLYTSEEHSAIKAMAGDADFTS